MTRYFLSTGLIAGLLAWAAPTLTYPLQAEEPFDYFRNSWNVVGLKDYAHGTRLTPKNELVISDNTQESATVRIRYGRELIPLSRKQAKRLLDGWLPVILITAEDESVRYEFTLWATPLPTVKDWQKAFDWPAEGENFLNWVVAKVTNMGDTTTQAKLKVEKGGASDSKSDDFFWSLPPGRSAEAVVRIPFSPVKDESDFAPEDAKLWLDRTVRYWRTTMAKGASIEVPCEKATRAYLSSHVCQLITSDHGELHPGEGFYDEFYIRDAAYQLMELEEAGLADIARKAVESFLSRQRSDGRFESQDNQSDANGQASWTLWQFYKITGDRQWLKEVYPQMRRAADWTMKARRQASADSPFFGVLPHAPADGEYLWDGKHHIVGYDLWNLRGLLCTADAAQALGRTDEAKELLREAELYREAIDAAWKRTGVAHFPPSWEKAGTHWGNTETLWPTELFGRDDPRVTALITEVRQKHGGGFIEGTIQWLGHAGAIHPYMSGYTTMASLIRGEHEQVVEDFYWYLLHSTATHAFPEGVYYKRRIAWNDTIPHALGASNYAIMLRHMLIHERSDELHLLMAVPDWWLAEGNRIRVARAPTHFGLMNLRVIGTEKGVKVKLDPPGRQPPKRIFLYLPKSRPLAESVEGIEVITRPGQKHRWDFPKVVRLYREHAAALFKQIPGLVRLPIEPASAPSQCRMLDLAPLANTNPFTAPFGVENPGNYVFTDMPVGVQTVGGVPFHIIDPTENGGRGFVVLHSPHAPADRKGPREIEIPVKEQGKRLFFLGNIHGWSPDDPGTGEWDAVAEYVVQYADGESQTVPLVTGCTTDDWALPPDTEEAFVGLTGDPWHLNVLGVKLRDVTIEKLIFRDLGTPAAPVLVAVTLDQ
ncbi:MAG: glucosidase family protein [Planctomycetota bacterium]|jgi:hypothetical protein